VADNRSIHELALPVADWVCPTSMASESDKVLARLLAETPIAWVPALQAVVVTDQTAIDVLTAHPDVQSIESADNDLPMTRSFVTQHVIPLDGAQLPAGTRVVVPK